MDNKQEALSEFIKGLRVVLNTALAYQKDHPYFRKSVELFKEKADMTFPFLDPIKIDIAPAALFVDGAYWDKREMYLELAQLFHVRKIKSIEFRSGISVDELLGFLHAISLPVKEILKQGGLAQILEKAKTAHLSVSDLDYSELLGLDGEEAKDIWIYLFKKAVHDGDSAKAFDLADNFEKTLGKFKGKDLCENEELRYSLYAFLKYLKEKEKSRYYACTQALLRLVLKDKEMDRHKDFEKVGVFFKDLNKEDISEGLLETIAKDDTYNNVSFSVFAKLFEEGIHKAVASDFEQNTKVRQFLKSNPAAIKRIKELFSVPDDSYITQLYHHALEWLKDEHSEDKGFSFDESGLPLAYRYLLLNLLNAEENLDNLGMIAQALLQECKGAIKERDIEYLKILSDELDTKSNHTPAAYDVVKETQSAISNFVETEVFCDEECINLGYFIERLKKSAVGFEVYLKNIFEEGKINRNVCMLLFKFFPEHITLLHEQLDKRQADIDFMMKVIKSLEGVDTRESLEVLKRIFYKAHTIIKKEILKILQHFSARDNEFLISILETQDPSLEKEALLALRKDAQATARALEGFLLMSSPWGRKNKLIEEHIHVVRDIEFKEATEALSFLSKKRFFWNRNVRESANKVLEDWNAGTG